MSPAFDDPGLFGMQLQPEPPQTLCSLGSVRDGRAFGVPVLQHARLQPLAEQAHKPPVRYRMFQELDQPSTADRVEER